MLKRGGLSLSSLSPNNARFDGIMIVTIRRVVIHVVVDNTTTPSYELASYTCTMVVG